MGGGGVGGTPNRHVTPISYCVSWTLLSRFARCFLLLSSLDIALKQQTRTSWSRKTILKFHGILPLRKWICGFIFSGDTGSILVNLLQILSRNHWDMLLYHKKPDTGCEFSCRVDCHLLNYLITLIASPLTAVLFLGPVLLFKAQNTSVNQNMTYWEALTSNKIVIKIY